MKKRLKVLLLGATGRIGTGFREEYSKHKDYQKKYELILGIHKSKCKDKKFKIRKVSLDSIENLKKAMKGIDIVVNLAANPSPNANFKELLKPNIIGTYNVFEAARQAKCLRVIFASSIFAVKGYGHGKQVKSSDAPEPIGLYGASKVFGEALCYTFFSEYNISCIAIRIGAYTSNEKIGNVCFSRHDYDHVISQRDMAQLLHKTIIAPQKLKYAILSGISNNKKRDLDLKQTKKLVRYNPKDDAYELCKKIKRTFIK